MGKVVHYAKCIRHYSRGAKYVISPSQVTSVLRMNESSLTSPVSGKECVKSFESNQLASNHPIEDRRAAAKLQESSGMLFGVFDGHAGCGCSQAVSERLFDYIAVALLSPDRLEKYGKTPNALNLQKLLFKYRHNNDYTNDDLSGRWQTSLQTFAEEILKSHFHDDRYISEALTRAFLRLDNDISEEARPHAGKMDFDSLNVAISGS